MTRSLQPAKPARSWEQRGSGRVWALNYETVGGLVVPNLRTWTACAT
jgi:hypothetical protein